MIELSLKASPPMKVNSRGAISIAHNPVQYDQTKQVEVERHFVKEKLKTDILLPQS